jgi:hypothetical protein
MLLERESSRRVAENFNCEDPSVFFGVTARGDLRTRPC